MIGQTMEDFALAGKRLFVINRSEVGDEARAFSCPLLSRQRDAGDREELGLLGIKGAEIINKCIGDVYEVG